jgi:hypothetical protein
VREAPAWTLPSGLQALQSAFAPESGGLALAQAVGSELTLAWDGRNRQGQWAASGLYTLLMTQTDPFGSTTSFSASVQLLRQGLDVMVDIYNSAGERVRHFSLNAPSGPSRLDLDQGGFVPLSLGGQDLKIVVADGSSLDWDGRNDRGELLSSGSYLIKVRGHQGGKPIVLSREVILLQALGAEPLQGALVAPNPLGPAQRLLRVLLPHAHPGLALRARIYGLSGELAAQLHQRGPDGSLSWDVEGAGAAAGVYLIELQALDAQGRWHRKVLKAAVLR